MSAGLLLASPASLAADLPPLILARAGESKAASAPQQLYLEISLNQTAYGTPQPFELRDGRLFASVATLRQIGFVLDGRGVP